MSSSMGRRPEDVSPLHISSSSQDHPPPPLIMNNAYKSSLYHQGSRDYAMYTNSNGSSNGPNSMMGGIGESLLNHASGAASKTTTASSSSTATSNAILGNISGLGNNHNITSSNNGNGNKRSDQNRSIPIAIVRDKGDSDKEMTSESSDDDDSVVDVERDAMRLRKKHQQRTDAADSWGMSKSLNASTGDTLLNAPYLGSMRQTEDFIAHHDIPLIRLSVDPLDHGNAPVEMDSHSLLVASSIPSSSSLVGTSGGAAYGSLRDSHQRKQFLDGPASYRDPRDGQIRRLNHRVQFHHGSLQNKVSIGERIQQAQKLRKIQQQKLDGDSKKPSGLSSLSAMMDQAGNFGTRDQPKTQASGDLRQSESVQQSTIHQFDSSPFDGEFGRQGDNLSDRIDGMMLSTSLTAFEVLRGSNASVVAAKYKRSSAIQRDGGVPVVASTKPNFAEEPRFKALSRSMSDPTPHLRPSATMLAGPLLSPQLSAVVPAAAPPPAMEQWNPHSPVARQPTQQHSPSYSMAYPTYYAASQPSSNMASQQLDNGMDGCNMFASPRSLSGQSQELDAAFDMDMEL